MNCIAHRDPRRELFNTLKKTNVDKYEARRKKRKKIVAKYVYDRFRERDRRVKYNLV